MRSILVALILSFTAFTAFTTHASPPVAASPGPASPGPDARVALAKQRSLQLARLRAYREAGQFTTDQAGRPASVFRDHAGRLCPMAYLIAASGRMDLVDKVARENNTLQLADVTEGPLWDWMLTSGLTREEIIRIQGIMRAGFDFELPRERGPTIMARRRLSTEPRVARIPSATRLRRDVVRKLDDVSRELTIANEVSLAVAVSRLAH